MKKLSFFHTPYFLLALVKTVTDNYNKINVMSR